MEIAAKEESLFVNKVMNHKYKKDELHSVVSIAT
jgi:hypothetical protein